MRGAVLFGLVLRMMHFPPATTLQIEQHIYILAGEKMIVAAVIIMVRLLILVAAKPFSVGKLKGEPAPTQGIRSEDEGLQVEFMSRLVQS